jgi:hypothetical protein
MTPQERIYAEELETRMQNSRTRREEIAREMDLLNGNLVGIEDTLGRGTWESEAWGASAIKDAESAIAET